MSNLIVEFRCPHLVERGKWISSWEGIQISDLCLRVFNNNLVVFEFVKQGVILGSRKFCWSGFLDFLYQFNEWFFEDESEEEFEMYASCVDKGLIQCAPIPDEFAVSLTIGKGEPEVTFYADRSDVLKMFDNTARVVKKQPIENAGCFKLTEVLTPCAGDKLPAALKLDTFAKMMISETRH